MEKKEVKCPKCSTRLAVTNSKGETEKIISCPKCGAKLRVKFNPQPAPSSGGETILPGMEDAPGMPTPPPVPTDDPNGTQFDYPGPGPAPLYGPPAPPPPVAGNDLQPVCTCALICNGNTYRLKPGQNSVGRVSRSIKADVPLQTTDTTISRFHAMIEVTCVNDGTFRAVISNGNNKNMTFVNNTPINQSDKIVLNNGDQIRMGESIIQYVC